MHGLQSARLAASIPLSTYSKKGHPMQVQLYRCLFLLTSLLPWVAQAQDDALSNEKLAAAKKAALLLVETEPTGDLVLPLNYFVEQFRKEYPVLGPDGKPIVNPVTKKPATLALTNEDKPILVATMFAEAMLEVAKPDDLTSAQYVAAWVPKEKELLATKVGQVDLLTDRQRQVWQQFLTEWRDKVLATDEGRFRDALRQAAYSLARVALNVEQDHVNRVLAGTSAPTGGVGSDGTGTGGYVGSAHHAAVMHERLMNGIYRRHDRRMYKIERSRARR